MGIRINSNFEIYDNRGIKLENHSEHIVDIGKDEEFSCFKFY